MESGPEAIKNGAKRIKSPIRLYHHLDRCVQVFDKELCIFEALQPLGKQASPIPLQIFGVQPDPDSSEYSWDDFESQPFSTGPELWIQICIHDFF